MDETEQMPAGTGRSAVISWWVAAGVLLPALLVAVQYLSLAIGDLLDMWLLNGAGVQSEWPTTVLLALLSGVAGFALGAVCLRRGCPRSVWMLSVAWLLVLGAAYLAVTVVLLPGYGAETAAVTVIALAAPIMLTVGLITGMLRGRKAQSV